MCFIGFRKLGVELWIVCIIEGIYSNARSLVKVKDQLSMEIEVKDGVHQGSLLIPLLFIITHVARDLVISALEFQGYT